MADLWDDEEWRAAMSAAEINDLPDSAFAYIEPGGEKDDDGKTTPRSLRHYPVHDEAHARNALSRASAAIDGDDEDAKKIAEEAMPKIKAACKKFGIDVADESKSLPATAIRADYRGTRETRISTASQFELREIPDGTGGTNLRFTGFACVTGAEYEMEDWLGPWIESVSAGSFSKTLSDGADVAFLLNHQGMTLARTKPGTLKLSEATDGASSPIYGITGLHSEALLDPKNMYVQAMRSAVERGDLDEMSFAFRVLRQEWNESYDRRWINEVSLDKGDVSLVNYGANPTTGGTVAMRQRLGIRDREPLDLRRVVYRMMELRYGATLSSDTMGQLQRVLDLIDASDTNVDNALIELSALMGVTNPDIAQDAALNRDLPEGDDEDAPSMAGTGGGMAYGVDDSDFERRIAITRRKGWAA